MKPFAGIGKAGWKGKHQELRLALPVRYSHSLLLPLFIRTLFGSIPDFFTSGTLILDPSFLSPRLVYEVVALRLKRSDNGRMIP